MYFFKYHPLKEQLRERTFSDRDGLPYYVLFIASSTFLADYSLGTSNGIDALSASINSAVAILGIIYSYRKNGGRTGYDFMQKSIVLGWVVIFRLMPFILLTGFVSYCIDQALGYPIESRSWVSIVLSALFMTFYYQRLGRHIQDTNRHNGEQGDTPDAARNAATVIP